jgi:hypothetical protein
MLLKIRKLPIFCISRDFKLHLAAQVLNPNDHLHLEMAKFPSLVQKSEFAARKAQHGLHVVCEVVSRGQAVNTPPALTKWEGKIEICRPIIILAICGWWQ